MMVGLAAVIVALAHAAWRAWRANVLERRPVVAPVTVVQPSDFERVRAELAQRRSSPYRGPR